MRDGDGQGRDILLGRETGKKIGEEEECRRSNGEGGQGSEILLGRWAGKKKEKGCRRLKGGVGGQGSGYSVKTWDREEA